MGFTFAWHAVFLCPKCQAPISRSEINGVGVPFDCKSCGTKIRLVRSLPKWHKWAYIGIGFPVAWLIGIHNPFLMLAATLGAAFVGGFVHAIFVPPQVEVYHAWSGVPTSLIVPKEPLE